MRTLIVIPKYEYGGKYVLPMGILYVSVALKKAGCDVATFNLNHCATPYDDLVGMIRNQGIGLVGSGGLSGEFSVLNTLFKTVKENFPGVKTFCGGGIITAEPNVAMQALGHVDIGVIGEGDESVPELVNAISSGRPLNEVRGIIFRSCGCGELIQTAYREEIRDLDVLPIPDYEGFEYGRYLAENDAGRGRSGERLTPVSIIGSRSCPYSCTFCFHPTGVRYRTRSLDSVFAEIDMLIRKYQINHVALREELFAADKERILDFCRRMSSYGDLHWSIQLRVNLVDEEIVSALSQAGCFAVFVGIESVDNDVLRSMNKMHYHTIGFQNYANG